MDHPAADQVADLVGLQFLADEDIDNTRKRLRCRRVDTFDARMRVRGTQEIGMAWPGRLMSSV
jgi:hypothetical protein